MARRMIWVAASLVGLTWLILPAAILGQTQYAEINGRVRDPGGLALPGATLTLAEPSTGFTRTAVSTQEGAYVVGNLRPGTYDMTVAIQGFKTMTQVGLVLSAGAEITVNWDLELATIEEVITVTGESPLIEVTSNKIGGTLATKEIDEIPTNFRQFADLSKFVAGMTPQPGNSTFEGGQVNAN